jgi:hypothetical protein
MGLRGGQDFQPPRLMPRINRGGHFLLTEMVKKTASFNTSPYQSPNSPSQPVLARYITRSIHTGLRISLYTLSSPTQLHILSSLPRRCSHVGDQRPLPSRRPPLLPSHPGGPLPSTCWPHMVGCARQGGVRSDAAGCCRSSTSSARCGVLQAGREDIMVR